MFSQNSYSQSFENFSLSDLREKISSPGFSDNQVKEFRMKKSPLKAVLYSAVLPGAGQFYNESYWKIPFIAGLGGYFAYGIIDNNNKYKDFRDRYIESQSQITGGDPLLKANRDFYRDQRDDFIIYALILYIVNVADAFVDAHMYDFDVSDEMKMGFFKKGIVSFKFQF